jgi:hypothetical protein
MSENIEYKVDRDGWPRGPWDNEEDSYEWRDEDTGLPCLIIRNSLGALCGYVGVPPWHPFHGCKDDGSSDVGSMDVHGGVTYTNKCAGLASIATTAWILRLPCHVKVVRIETSRTCAKSVSLSLHRFTLCKRDWLRAKITDQRRSTGICLAPNETFWLQGA